MDNEYDLPPEELHKQMSLLLNLPSHVTVLFVAVILGLWAILIAGLDGGLKDFAALMLFLSIILPIRNLLIWVDREREKYHTSPDEDLQPLVNSHARQVGVNIPPKIERSATAENIHAVGGLRRKLIIGRNELLDQIYQDIQSPESSKGKIAKAILMHELQHFLRYDTRFLGLADSVIGLSAKWAVWVMLMAIGQFATMALFLKPILEAVLKPNWDERFKQLSPEAYSLIQPLMPPHQDLTKLYNALPNFDYGLVFFAVIINLIPFIVGAFLLKKFVVSAMWRVREHYADLGTEKTVGVGVLQDYFLDNPATSLFPSSKIQQLIQTLYSMLYSYQWLHNKLQFFINLFNNLFVSHPSLTDRSRALARPIQFMTDPRKNGVIVGVFLLCMSFTLTSGFSLGIIGAWPWHVGALGGFISIAILMTPSTLYYDLSSAQKNLWKCLAWAIGIGYVWVTLNIITAIGFLIVSPDLMFKMLEVAAFSMVGLFSTSSSIIDEQTPNVLIRVIIGNLLALPVSIIALYAIAWLDLRLKRRYLAGLLEHPDLSRLCWGITLVLAAALFIILTILTAVLLFEIDKLLEMRWILGLVTLLSVGGVLWIKQKIQATRLSSL